jgi:hypothetical protein
MDVLVDVDVDVGVDGRGRGCASWALSEDSTSLH